MERTMTYEIKVFSKDYLNKEVTLVGVIPTNIQLSPADCLLRARSVFGDLVTDRNCLFAYQKRWGK